MPSIALCSIKQSDQTFLAQLYASTRVEELAVIDWSQQEKNAFLQMQFEAQHQFYQEQFADAEFDLIVKDEQPIGRLYVQRREDEIRIIDIALLPEYRNGGIGGKLLQGLLDEAEKMSLPVRIHVERFNRALSLYKRLGFSAIDDNGVYYLLEWLPCRVTVNGHD